MWSDRIAGAVSRGSPLLPPITMRRVDLGVERATATLVRPMVDGDWPKVRDIYAQGIATGNATFETQPSDFTGWSAAHLAEHRLVAVRDGAVVGWSALSSVSDRCVYAGVAWVSTYVAENARGKHIGRVLLEAMITHADASDIWTLQAGIFPENVASIRLHERCGFRIVGTRERLGRLHGRWRDVLLLERRKP